jgi:hypothetical protein
MIRISPLLSSVPSPRPFTAVSSADLASQNGWGEGQGEGSGEARIPPHPDPLPQNLEAKTMQLYDVGTNEFWGRGDE